MGRGDRRSKKGKIWRGTFGKTRPRKENEENTEKAGDKKTADTKKK